MADSSPNLLGWLPHLLTIHYSSKPRDLSYPPRRWPITQEEQQPTERKPRSLRSAHPGYLGQPLQQPSLSSFAQLGDHLGRAALLMQRPHCLAGVDEGGVIVAVGFGRGEERGRGQNRRRL